MTATTKTKPRHRIVKVDATVPRCAAKTRSIALKLKTIFQHIVTNCAHSQEYGPYERYEKFVVRLEAMVDDFIADEGISID